MKTISKKVLESKIQYLNRRTGNNQQPFNGKNWNVGSYYLCDQNGKYALYKVTSEKGSATNVLDHYVSKSQLADLIDAYMAGVIDIQENNC